MERRQYSSIRNTIEWLAGSAAQPLQQLQLLLMVIAALYMWATGLFNLYFGIGYNGYSYAMMGMAFITTLLWYLGRWQGRCYLATVMLLFVLILCLLPAIYLANGGISGPALMYALVVIAYCYGVLKPKSIEKLLLITLALTLPLPLMYLEFHRPQWIYWYDGLGLQMLDLWVSFFLCATLLVAVVAGHVRRFKQELRRAQRLADELERLAQYDGLTNIFNHRATFEYARQQMLADQPMSVIIFDLDYFKQINDTYGHPFGDEVLVAFAKVLSDNAEGVVGRIGGEEFMLICQTSSERVMERIMQTIRAKWQQVDLDNQPITFSAGIATRKPADTLESLWQRADEALYFAKHNGRNQWQVAA